MKCKKCGQDDNSQVSGEYPCPVCGIPTLWDDNSDRERLAEYIHNVQWAGWMTYLFSKCTLNDDGTATIPTWAVVRWQRQLTTPYAQLSDAEQDSDRREADAILASLQRPNTWLETDAADDAAQPC
jgi:hypothetical protein